MLNNYGFVTCWDFHLWTQNRKQLQTNQKVYFTVAGWRKFVVLYLLMNIMQGLKEKAMLIKFKL